MPGEPTARGRHRKPGAADRPQASEQANPTSTLLPDPVMMIDEQRDKNRELKQRVEDLENTNFATRMSWRPNTRRCSTSSTICSPLSFCPSGCAWCSRNSARSLEAGR